MSTRQRTRTPTPAGATEPGARTSGRLLLLAVLALGSLGALPPGGSAATESGQTTSALSATVASTTVIAQDRPRLTCALPRRVALAEHVSPMLLCTNPVANLRRR